MSISKDLLLAILSMDAYNRGYGAGISDNGANDTDGLGESGVIGGARILARPNGVDYQAWQDAGFYAISYDVKAAGVDGLDADTTDTIFRGEKGVAEWQRVGDAGGGSGDGSGATNGGDIKSVIPDAKGFGSMADLSVQAASDFTLADTITAATSAMGLDANGLPSLKQLRTDATPVFGAWSQSLELTRELTPVLLNKAADGTSLVDRAVYVEDTSGGFWQLASGNDVLDSGGVAITRATIEDIMAQPTSGLTLLNYRV